jgi:sulfide dehydrogenase cytochrome subunit
MKKTLSAGALMALATIASAQTGPVLPANAAYLAGNCSNCHGTTGTAKGAMPSLAGLQKPYIIEQMVAFRDGKRPSTIMTQIAKGYTDQQIEQVADYFSRQKPGR